MIYLEVLPDFYTDTALFNIVICQWWSVVVLE